MSDFTEDIGDAIDSADTTSPRSINSVPWDSVVYNTIKGRPTRGASGVSVREGGITPWNTAQYNLTKGRAARSAIYGCRADNHLTPIDWTPEGAGSAYGRFPWMFVDYSSVPIIVAEGSGSDYGRPWWALVDYSSVPVIVANGADQDYGRRIVHMAQRAGLAPSPAVDIIQTTTINIIKQNWNGPFAGTD